MFTIIFLDNLLTQNWDAVCPDGSEWLWENNDRATPLWSFRWSASGEYTGYKKLDYVGCKFFWRFGVLWRRRLPSWVKCIADIYHNHTTGSGVLFSSWGRERDIFAYFGQLWLFCHEFTHFLVYFLQAKILRRCLKIDKYQVWSNVAKMAAGKALTDEDRYITTTNEAWVNNSGCPGSRHWLPCYVTILTASWPALLWKRTIGNFFSQISPPLRLPSSTSGWS